VAVTRPEEALARFEFRRGQLRGSQLLLHPRCLIHRGGAQLETLPLPAIAAVRVSFERNLRKLRWGAGLLMAAAIVFALASPLSALASAAAGEMAPHLNAGSGSQGIAGVLHATFRFFEAIASVLPGVATALAVAGAASAALGWLGETRLTVGFAGAERSYCVPGRDAALLQFAEALSERAVECAASGAR
jgi:hypothetical protein